MNKTQTHRFIIVLRKCTYHLYERDLCSPLMKTMVSQLQINYFGMDGF